MRAHYQEPDGGFLRLPGAALIASVLGGGAFLGGRAGSEPMLDGALSFLAPLADAVRTGLPMTDDTVSWGVAGAAASGVGLLIALATEPRRKGLALVSLLALVLFGLMLAGGRGGEVAGRIAERTGLDEVVPAPPLRAAAPACPDGSYPLGEACQSCRIVKEVRAGPALTFTPVRTTAAWGYAKDDAFTGRTSGGPIQGLAALTALPVSADALCLSDAALVLGSASSDGPAARNAARARRRAARLAGEVRRRCPGLPVYAASLGQSSAASDVADDRAITVLAVSARDQRVSAATVEAELGHALATGLGEAPLLTRLGHFRSDWTWIDGGTGRFRPEPVARPTVREAVLRPGAPARCRAQS